MSQRSIMQLIQSASKPKDYIAAPEVAARFKENYMSIFGINEMSANAFYLQEQQNFLQIINESSTLQKCTPFSLYAVFMLAAKNGLSFDSVKKHVYIIPYGGKATLAVSPYGELELRKMYGQIRHADEPQIVWDGDFFEQSGEDGNIKITHKRVFGNEGQRGMVACYIRITRFDGSTYVSVMSFDDLMYLKQFSKSGNSAAWTKGLRGMFKSKCIRHAFRNTPLPAIGMIYKFQADVNKQDIKDITDLDYDSMYFDLDTETGEVKDEQPQAQLPEANNAPVPTMQQPDPVEVKQQPPVQQTVFTPKSEQSGIKFDNTDESF